jgi:hypothetical protein
MPKDKIDRTEERHRLELAAKRAAEVVEVLGIRSAPVDPLKVVESEYPLLRAEGADFRDRFDGQLEYHRLKNRFVLLFNTKYDASPGEHHPRTRFSIAHELGHYFIERHHSYLIRGGRSHASTTEFKSDRLIEREADTFASHLLIPADLLSAELSGEVTFEQVRRIAGLFRTSVMSTAIRCVQASDFPCALAAIRDDSVAWVVASEPLIRGGCYPKPHALIPTRTARERWGVFSAGGDPSGSKDSLVKHWFETYQREELGDIVLSEEYHPVRVMGTMLVLLTIAEEDLFPDDEDSEDDDD